MTAFATANRLLAAILLAVMICLPSASQAKQKKAQPNLSREMKILLRQTNEMYASRFHITVDKLVNSDPRMFASILGVTLQRQLNYAGQNQQYVQQYRSLNMQCEGLLRWIAETKNNRNPKDGKPMGAEVLIRDFKTGLHGVPNSFFIQKFGVDPATVNLPMMLGEVPVLEGSAAASGRGSLNEKKGVNLLGERAQAAEVGNHSAGQGEVVYVGKMICPDKGLGSLRLDTNNNPKDETYVYCSFWDDGRLSHQVPTVEGKKHGVEYRFTERDGIYYLANKAAYSMGKLDGVREVYRVKNGRVYLSERIQFADGKMNGTREDFRVDGSGQHYQSRLLRYVDGKQHGTQERFELSKSGGVYRISVAEYFRGKEHGERRAFSENGQLLRREIYQDGVMMKYWQYARNTGQLRGVYCRSSQGGFRSCQ
ncbi:hypothetical protein GM415_01740 [Pseudodesulfovibrio cashew]|uniref:Toxin-antitoxin system YwqK family antitoxin n=1 Tax=Pseudodesulfovibrio cashew TaxID=2678688 RepID=A0A6I6JCX3_9BACT|nr:hypothetical protein [Pseudodesulfovibrio cashew]QGY38910.1 hypothetical protein GM415_01740 [Pseudodesulfovibrio cashew]